MKTIAVEINIGHVADEPIEVQALREAGVEPDKMIASGINESFTLCVHQDIDDSEPSSDHAEKLIAELGRRYRCLNARKTN
jgi:hypothetical protein